MLRSVITAHTKPLAKVMMTGITSKMIADCVKPLADCPAQRDNVISLIFTQCSTGPSIAT